MPFLTRKFLCILTFLYDNILLIWQDDKICKHLKIWGVNNAQNESRILFTHAEIFKDIS